MGRGDMEIDHGLGAAYSAVSGHGGEERIEPVYVPTITYVYDIWKVTERVRLQIHAAKITRLHKVSEGTVWD